MMPTIPDDLAIAVDLLRQYQSYSEEMRSIGRGFSPVSKEGITVEYFLQGVLDGYSRAIQEREGGVR